MKSSARSILRQPISTRIFAPRQIVRIQSIRANSTQSSTDTLYSTINTAENHYSHFPNSLAQGPPPRGHFSFDTRALRSEFLKKQQTIHPDTAPQSHKAQAENASANLNKAYSTLLDPLTRAQYLLSLRGVDVVNDESTEQGDQMFLADVMEICEQIEDAESQEEVNALKKENGERLKDSVKLLEEAFAQDDMVRAKKETVRLRYWSNIKDNLNDWEPGKEVIFIH